MTQTTPNYESFYGLYAGEVGLQCLYQILSGQLFRFMIRTQDGLVLYVSTRPRPRPLRGRFMVHTGDGSVLYAYTEFKTDSSIRSKVIRGSSKRFEIGSRDPGHAHLVVFL